MVLAQMWVHNKGRDSRGMMVSSSFTVFTVALLELVISGWRWAYCTCALFLSTPPLVPPLFLLSLPCLIPYPCGQCEMTIGPSFSSS
jgi:hypothetical protein